MIKSTIVFGLLAIILCVTSCIPTAIKPEGDLVTVALISVSENNGQAMAKLGFSGSVQAAEPITIKAEVGTEYKVSGNVGTKQIQIQKSLYNEILNNKNLYKITINNDTFQIESLNNVESKNLIIEPKISCFVNYAGSSQPYVVILNEGPTKVQSLTLDVIQAVYNDEIDQIFFSQFAPIADGHLLSLKEFYPFQKKYKEVGKMDFQISGGYSNTINIYTIFVTYYRDVDYKKIMIRKTYFIENNTVYDEEEFKGNKNYSKLIEYTKDLAPQNQLSDEHRYQILRQLKVDPKSVYQ